MVKASASAYQYGISERSRYAIVFLLSLARVHMSLLPLFHAWWASPQECARSPMKASPRFDATGRNGKSVGGFWVPPAAFWFGCWNTEFPFDNLTARGSWNPRT